MSWLRNCRTGDFHHDIECRRTGPRANEPAGCTPTAGRSRNQAVRLPVYRHLFEINAATFLEASLKANLDEFIVVNE